MNKILTTLKCDEIDNEVEQCRNDIAFVKEFCKKYNVKTTEDINEIFKFAYVFKNLNDNGCIQGLRQKKAWE